MKRQTTEGFSMAAARRDRNNHQRRQEQREKLTNELRAELKRRGTVIVPEYNPHSALYDDYVARSVIERIDILRKVARELGGAVHFANGRYIAALRKAA